MIALVFLKSGKKFKIPDFSHINYPDSDGKTVSVTDKDLEQFYLYDNLLTFVGKDRIATLQSTDIEYVGFSSEDI